MMPVEPVAVPKLAAKTVGLVQFDPIMDKSTAPSNALALLAPTTTVEVDTSQNKHAAVSLIVACELKA